MADPAHYHVILTKPMLESLRTVVVRHLRLEVGMLPLQLSASAPGRIGGNRGAGCDSP